MKPFASVVKAKLMSQPAAEAPLIIQDFKDGLSSYPSNNISGFPVFGSNTAGDSRLRVFSSRQKYPCSLSYSKDLKPHIEGTLLPLLAKDQSAMTKCTSVNNVSDSDISGRHFLFDRRWRNGMYITNDIEDNALIKQNSTIRLPSQEFHVYQSHNFTRFAHRKEFSQSNPKPLIFGSDYLTSFPSVLLPATTPSVSEKHCLSLNYKNRSRMKSRARNLFTVGANKKPQSYPDPLLSASASFVQRLMEISSLEADTVRQEKIKRLKKINRQDT
ncbi:uncharacterized protein si:ch211-171b20.3 [Myxocyprinus asiaticus]|uniref:uncharacterized protein si:ch211-171b20.3 n=1 Tax=Myxocyprinus asiaticus TaxID=70543 RepID=UPI0022237DC5|nr:uncharacterized protein si:ch211-171b20.3 [Myxocyprinus asiaticus]